MKEADLECLCEEGGQPHPTCPVHSMEERIREEDDDLTLLCEHCNTPLRDHPCPEELNHWILLATEPKQLAHQQPRRWPSEVPLFGKPAPVHQQPSSVKEQSSHAANAPTAEGYPVSRAQLVEVLVEIRRVAAVTPAHAAETFRMNVCGMIDAVLPTALSGGDYVSDSKSTPFKLRR